MDPDQILAVTDALNLLSLMPIQLAPPPQHPPPCHLCGQSGTRRTTGEFNGKGNAGRPFYKCDTCNNFLCFADHRGNDVSNPSCYCQASSKRQRAGADKEVPGGLHFVCRLGRCGFYQACKNPQGQHLTVPDDLVETMKNLSFI